MIKASDNLYEITTPNYLCYMSMSGVQTTTIVVNIDLVDPVNGEALKAAVGHVLERYDHYRMTLVLKENQLYYTLAKGELPVYKEKGSLQLGSEENGGYLFAVSYKKKRIRLRIHHGLADGRGIFEFSKSLLYYYFLECGIPVEPEDKVITKETPRGETEDLDPFAAFGDVSIEPLGQFISKEAFCAAEEDEYEDQPRCYRYELALPIGDLLKAAKKVDSSPLPLLTVLISAAFRKTWDVGDQPVTGYVPLDLRTRFDMMTLQNCAYFVPLPHTKRNSNLPLDTQATVQRGIMDLQLQEENLRHRMGALEKGQQDFKAVEVPFAAKQKAATARSRAGSKTRYSYVMTYVGKISLPELMRRQVNDFMINIPAFDIPLAIAAAEYDGILNLVITQRFDNDQFAKNLLAECEKLVRNAVLRKSGVEEFDYLLPEDIPSEG